MRPLFFSNMKYEVVQVPRSYILEMIQRIQEICSKFQFVSLNHQVAACQDFMSDGGPIDIAIFGGPGSGKSSFINSLIGRPVLPVGVIPVTSAITRLQYGHREHATVTHFDGSHQEIAPSELATFTSDSVNQYNRLNIETVDVELPDLVEYENLRFIDTPNIASVFQYQRYASDAWLGQVGAAFVVIGADQILTGNDFEMIRELIQYTPHVAILLTKVDHLPSSQRNETLEYLGNVLERELNRSFPIYPYSTVLNVEQWKYRIEAEVLHRLSVNRNVLFKNILLHRCQHLVNACLYYMDLATAISKMDHREKNEVYRGIIGHDQLYEHARSTLTTAAKESAGMVRPAVWKQILGRCSPIQSRLSAELTVIVPTWQGSLWRLYRQYRSWFNDMMSEELRSLSRTERRRLMGILRKTHSSFSYALGEFNAALADNIKTTLGFEPLKIELDIDFMEPEPPHPEITIASDYAWKYLSPLFPMIIFRRMIERQLYEQLPLAVKQNLSRFAGQWEGLVLKSIRTMRRQAIRRIKDELATIQVLFNMYPQQMHELMVAAEDLRNRSDLLWK